jgi:hypothetical protein
LSSKPFSKKNLLFEAEIYVPGYAQNAGFAPFTPELLGALSGSPAVRTTSQAIGQPNNFLDNLNLYLGCPNDY